MEKSDNRSLEKYSTRQFLQGDTAYFLRDWIIERTNDYQQLVRLYAYDANWLLSTRIVAYAAVS